MTTSVKNRGKDLEALVVQSNHVYQMRQEAVIHQAHAEVKTIRGCGRKDCQHFLQRQGGLDFYGIADKRYVTFDTKQTANKTNFPLSNVEYYQYNTIIETDKAGGIAFLLVHFSYWGEMYYLNTEQLKQWCAQRTDPKGRQSISHNWVRAHARLVESRSAAALDWLSVVRVELSR